jgi:hypothetical protein
VPAIRRLLLGPFPAHVLALLTAVVAFVLLARGESGRPRTAHEVSLQPSAPRDPLVIVFVDSLSDRVATNPELMPALSALAARGVALSVEPCRDRLTYLCLRAVLTGYDESNLLEVGRNFDRQRRVAADHLLARAADSGVRVVALGSHDFEAYRDSLAEYEAIDGEDETERAALRALDAGADVTLVSLANGDRAAHAYGTSSAQYREAFRRIDRLIARVLERAGADHNVLVFGDHGHDADGRHLPGGPSTTYAVYAGPAFERGVVRSMALTDHRALLGVLLGMPTPPSYVGPRFDELFDPNWLARHYRGGLPVLSAPPKSERPPRSRWFLAAGVALIALFVLVRVGRSLTRNKRVWLGASALGLGIAIASGHAYTSLRRAIHDHGFEPERSLYLLVPLGAGFLIAALVRRGRSAMRSIDLGAAISLVVSFLLLFPSAYYYGSARAVVPAAALGVVAAMLTYPVEQSVRSPWARVAPWMAAVFVLISLASFYDVHRVGGDATEMASYVLGSIAYQKSAWVALLGAKLVLLACAARLARGRFHELGAAVALALTAFVIELGVVTPSRFFYLALIGLVLAAHVLAPDRLRFVRIFAGLIVLSHLYSAKADQVAPIQVLLAACSSALWLFQKRYSGRARSIAVGATLLVGAYLLLWPCLGFRFSGIDFAFMFEWVPIARYEELWWVIGIGTLVKLAWPYLLLSVVAGPSMAEARSWLLAALAAKLVLLASFACFYATRESVRSNLALEMLAELALLSLVFVFFLPRRLRLAPAADLDSGSIPDHAFTGPVVVEQHDRMLLVDVADQPVVGAVADELAQAR